MYYVGGTRLFQAALSLPWPPISFLTLVTLPQLWSLMLALFLPIQDPRVLAHLNPTQTPPMESLLRLHSCPPSSQK